MKNEKIKRVFKNQIRPTCIKFLQMSDHLALLIKKTRQTLQKRVLIIFFLF